MALPCDGPPPTDRYREQACPRTRTTVEDTSTRRRILVATAEGARPQRADQAEPVRGGAAGRGVPAHAVPLVRLQAGTSRRASATYEREMFDTRHQRSAPSACAAPRSSTRALRFIVQYQQSYSGVRLVDIEPEVVIAQLASVLPVMRARLLKLCFRAQRPVKAATAIRVAGLALHRAQRRRRSVPGAAAPRGRHQTAPDANWPVCALTGHPPVVLVRLTIARLADRSTVCSKAGDTHTQFCEAVGACDSGAE